jgi:hypothetical protein
MNLQGEDGYQPAPEGGTPKAPRYRKPYESPELQEWGSILDLTQGLGQGFADLPKKGGSIPA